jgi:serine/threonine-protein kinase
VITDFGIARSMDDAGVTQEGAIVGTPRYMAPEQLSGQAIDKRADIFALGVMLYELATGARPWSGDNAITIAVAQATQPVSPLQYSSLPSGFTALIMRCIEIEPSRRPQTAGEVLATLRSPDAMIEKSNAPSTVRARPSMPPATMPTVTQNPSTLAVLPLACAAADEYLADGLHEDLTDILSTTPNLRVRPAGWCRRASRIRARSAGSSTSITWSRLAAPHACSTSGSARG